MRRLIPVLAGVLVSISATAAPLRFYVASPARPTAPAGIYTGTLDSATGALGPVTWAAAATAPNFLALSPDGKNLYAADGARKQSLVDAFAVRPDGSLQRLARWPVPGMSVCHLAVSASGRSIFTAAYSNGIVACSSLNQDGSPGSAILSLALYGKGPNPKRQTGPHAHSIYPSPDGRFVYACDLGTDRVWIFRRDESRREFEPAHPPFASVPPGSGPRHLAFGADGKQVYVVNEMGCSVTVFARDAATGALAPRETVSTLPPGISAAGNGAAEIALHPSGRWIYVSNRGCDTISVLNVGPDGGLALAQTVPARVKTPRHFALDPAGRWLIAEGQADNRLVVFRIDPATGRLQPTGPGASVPTPMCLMFGEARSLE